MSDSADELSKSEDISVNNKSANENGSPNFTNAYNAWRKYGFTFSYYYLY